MKLTEKKRLVEFSEYIEFPTLIYIYETKKIIAINDCAKEILGKSYNQLKGIAYKGIKFRVNQKKLENQSMNLYNQTILLNDVEVEIDIEFNSIIFEKQHIIICFFDLSYKHSFLKELKVQVPRMLWKNSNLKIVGINESAKEDVSNDIFDEYVLFKGLENEEKENLLNEEKSLIDMKENQYNVFRTIKLAKLNEPIFVKAHRVPLVNKKDKVIGIIVVYQIILSKEEYKLLFKNIVNENNILNEVLRRSTVIIASWKEKSGWPVEYISSNISKYGYTSYDFYDEKLNWKDIIYVEDQKRVEKEIKEADDLGKNLIKLEYRIKKQNGEPVWILSEIETIFKNNKICSRHGMICNIENKQ